jgi:phospholipase/carboxylesterase
LSLSGYLPNAEKILTTASAANFITPIFAAHGIEDSIVPYSLGQQLNDALQENNYLVSWHSYAMEHSVCEEEIGDIAEWLQQIFMPND